jgi:hypothetical protein
MVKLQADFPYIRLLGALFSKPPLYDMDSGFCGTRYGDIEKMMFFINSLHDLAQNKNVVRTVIELKKVSDIISSRIYVCRFLL